MPILLGHLQISPDDIKSLEDAQKLVGSLPARVTVVGDVENYPEGVLEFLLVRAVRPMLAAGATFDRAMYLVHPKTPFPTHLLEVPLPGSLSAADKAATVEATDALWLDLRGISTATLDTFLDGLRKKGIFPMRGTTTSGPSRINRGLYSGTLSVFSAAFYGSDADAVVSGLRAAGLPVSRVNAPPPPDPLTCDEPGCDGAPISESDFCANHQD